MKRLLGVVLSILGVVLLSACATNESGPDNEAWQINSNTRQTYIYEEVYIGSNHDVDVDWYLKIDDGAYELYKAQTDKIYFRTEVVGNYTFKAIHNDVESNNITIEFKD